MTDAKITIRELPPRPRRLTAGQLSAVFGGCSGNGSTCEVDKNCCSGYACTGVESSGGIQSARRFCQPK